MQNYTNGTPPSQKYRTTENEKSGEGEVKPIKSVQPVQAWHLHYSNTGAKKKIICTNWKHQGSEHCLCLDSLWIVPAQLICFRYNLKW